MTDLFLEETQMSLVERFDNFHTQILAKSSKGLS
jgi:hypothetical protein